MGLAPDKAFIAHLIRSLDSKFANMEDSDLSLTLNEFIKMFKQDKFLKDLNLITKSLKLTNSALPKSKDL